MHLIYSMLLALAVLAVPLTASGWGDTVGEPRCTFAADALTASQLSIAGNDTRTCGAKEQGAVAAVTDATSASDCSDIPNATGGGNVSLLVQWDESLGAAGEWKCLPATTLGAVSPSDLTQEGATEGEAICWDDGAGQWAPCSNFPTPIAWEAIPGAPTDPNQLYIVTNAAGACDISTAGSARALISWDGSAWGPLCDGSGGGGGITGITASSGGTADGPNVTVVGFGTVSTSRSGDTITITGTGDGGTVDGLAADSGGTTTGATVAIAGGTNVSTSRSADTVTINATDTNTNAATLCLAGEFLNGDGSCDSVPVDTNTNAATICTGSDVLEGSGACVANGDGGTVDGITADSGGTTTGATITLEGGTNVTTSRSGNTVTIDSTGGSGVTTGVKGDVNVVGEDSDWQIVADSVTSTELDESDDYTVNKMDLNDDLTVGLGCEDGNNTTAACFTVDVSSGTVIINRADDSGSSWLTVPPEADGEVRALAGEATQGGTNAYVFDADLNEGTVTNLTTDYAIQPRVLLWDSEDEATGWDSTTAAADFGGSTIKDTSPFVQLEIVFTGIEWPTDCTAEGGVVEMYWYMLDETGAVDLDNALYSSETQPKAPSIPNPPEDVLGYFVEGTNYGQFNSMTCSEVVPQNNVANHAWGKFTIMLPSWTGMSAIPGSFEVGRTIGNGAGNELLSSSGQFIYRGQTANPTGIRLEPYDTGALGGYDMDLSGAKARIYGIR